MTKPNYKVFEIKGHGLTESDLQEIGLFSDTGKKADISVSVAYAREAWFRRCADIVGHSLAGMPWDVFRDGSEEPIWSHDGMAPDELDWLDLYTYLFRSSVSIKLMGAAYSQKEGASNAAREITNPTGLKWWSPTSVEPVQTPQGILEYKRTVNGVTRRVPAGMVVATFAPGIFNEQGPAWAEGLSVKAHAQVLHDLNRFTGDQLRNGLIKRMLFVAPADMPTPGEPERKRFRLAFKRFWSGPETDTGQVLTGGVEPKVMGSDLTDLHSDKITKDNREAIATGFGVPFSLVSSSAANFATKQADQVDLYTLNIIPLSRIIQTALNKQLFIPMGLRILFDPSRLEVMQQHELQKAQSVSLLTGGVPMMTRQRVFNFMGWKLTPEENAELDRMISAAPPSPQSKSADLSRWFKKTSAKGRFVSFDSDTISPSEQGVIRERLSTDLPLEDVFRPPFVGF